MGVLVSTFGVGLNFNEKLLQEISTIGCGSFHFVENSERTLQHLREEIVGAAVVVARDCKVFVRPVGDVQIGEIFGYFSERWDTLPGNKGEWIVHVE